MTQRTPRIQTAFSSGDVLWIRFRVAALLNAAHAMATTEHWHGSYVVAFDAVAFYELARAGEDGRVAPAGLSPERMKMWTGRPAQLAAYPTCATAYDDIMKVLRKYV